MRIFTVIVTTSAQLTADTLIVRNNLPHSLAAAPDTFALKSVALAPDHDSTQSSAAQLSSAFGPFGGN